MHADKDDLDHARYADFFFEYASRGGKRHLEGIKYLLDSDPKKNFYERSDPNHLINRKNFLGQTPIYIAAKHGNLNAVKLLLERGANPKLESSISEGETENLLEVTARWNHINVFNYLLRHVEWTEDEIKKVAALKRRTPQVTKHLKEYSQQKFDCMFNFCLCI